ncbi:MAG: hypothetical protein ACFFFB_00585 [Candidatus Heimdallarchaeota archaeon]
MHFIKKIIETPILENPAKNQMFIHRHFYRYSRGDFTGPALKISKTSAKITLKGSHEYEDLILELVTRSIPNSDEVFEIKGNLITGSDIQEQLSQLGLSWNLKMSTGKTKNFKSDIKERIKKEKLLEIIDPLRTNSYLLLSFNINPNCKITTKKNIPQPSKKKIEEDDVNQRIQFCTGYLNNTNKNVNYILDSALSDFISEIPDKWKVILILNNYKINDIILPKDVKDSRILRIIAIRKGILMRSIEIDGDLIEKQYNIVV